MGTGRGWSVQVQVSRSVQAWRRGEAGRVAYCMAQLSGVGKRTRIPRRVRGRSWRCCRYLCLVGAAASPAQRRLLRVPRAAVTRTCSRSRGSGEDHPQSQTITQPILHHRVTPHCSAPCSHRVSPHTPILRPAGSLALLPRDGAGMDHFKAQARPVTDT